MTPEKIQQLAQRLDQAAMQARAVPQHSESDALTLADAYLVQAALVQCRVARNHSRIGVKMGFTSRAKMAQMGLSDMIWGRLTSDMLIEEGTAISLSAYVHPRVEPEVCFLLRRPLEGRVTLVQALAAVEAVAPALELIDSRYENFKFSLPDVVADNASSSGVVLGHWRRPDLDCANLGLVLTVNGRNVEAGSTAAILGHPLRSLVAAANLAAMAGERLEAGSIVLAGAATAAIALTPEASVRSETQYLGTVGFSVKAQESV